MTRLRFFPSFFPNLLPSMLRFFSLLSGLLFLSLPLCARAQTAAPAPGSPTDPAKVAELHDRFVQGLQLLQQGKSEDALAIFTGILKEVPNAPGSLTMAATVELQLGQPEKALDYLNPLYALNPKDYKPIVLLIQANQELHRDIRVEEFRKELFAIRNAGTEIHGLTDAQDYPREKIYPDNKGGEIEINEFFDYKSDPYIAWEALQVASDGTLVRHLVASYNPDETAELRKKDPVKLADVEAFLFGEFVIKDKQDKQFNLYRQETALPSYNDFRDWVLAAIKEPPKPILVQPIN